jgi:SagB-type dehydrogenase family enzyme
VTRAAGRFVRSPNLVAYWKDGAFVLEEFRIRRRITVAPFVTVLLHAFDRPRSLAEAAREFPRWEPRAVERELRTLARLGFLQPAESRSTTANLFRVWEESFPAVYYQFASKDVPYITSPAKQLDYFRGRLAQSAQPPFYKTYPKARSVALPNTPSASCALGTVLERRRTVRSFGRGPVSLDAFAATVRGTFGQTGTLEAGLLGRLVAKSSPSAGARHPIECYALVWKVRGLAPGLYHYSVRSGRLERLRSGDFRGEAVRMASSQTWIRSAAFLCILTAVTDRVFWKYRLADAYRVFFLDAGHLAQTFVLLATAAGLAPFTTAALQESRIEKLCGLDGVREFPVYLCGAGAPTPARRGPVSFSDPISSSERP